MVPANATIGTSDFCVSQYEMKVMDNSDVPVFDGTNGGTPLNVSLYKPDARPNGVPWVRITHTDTIAECASLGSDYHLITGAEWAAMARNVESVATNWSSGVVGTGVLNRGHSDGAASATAVTDGYAAAGSPLLSAGDGTDSYVGTGQTGGEAWGSGKEQKRTWLLTTGYSIWDIGGNARERVDVDGMGSTMSYTGPGSSGYYENQSATVSAMVATITFSASAGAFDLNWLTPATSSMTDAANYVGIIYVNSGANSLRTMSRGGNFSSGNGPGIFAGDFDGDATSTSSSAGFRCVKSL